MLSYGNLHVEDARGNIIPSRLVVGRNYVAIEWNDEAASYPVSIDPLITSPTWTTESDQADAAYGVSVSTAGDVNGDGYSDVIVGAEEFDSGETNEGKAYLYLGSSTGLSTTAAWTAEGNQAEAFFGYPVGAAGDVDGDGYGDVIIGASFYDNGQTDEGRVFVYYGSSSGLPSSASWTAESDQSGAEFGSSAGTAGDVNGDGYADVIIGAWAYGPHAEGRAYIYHGSSSGLPGSANWTEDSDGGVMDHFGCAVSTAGDVNGDGYDDVIVGAYEYYNGSDHPGRAFLYEGSASGAGNTAAWWGEGENDNAMYGASVSTAGDVNADGYADVIVGEYQQHDPTPPYTPGRALAYYGSGSGLSEAADWYVEGAGEIDEWYAACVATAGDVNGDGFADVLVGASGRDNGQTNEGMVWLYCGGSDGLSETPTWTGEGNQADAGYGVSVATAGDVDGDGYSDVIVGARFYDNGQTDEGRAYLYRGSASGLATEAAAEREADQADANFGYSVASAGDVNGDGYTDILVGAPNYDDGETDEGRVFLYLGSATGVVSSAISTKEGDQAGANFGLAVGPAGDVDGDGYGDVIIGAPYYDDGQTDEGKAYVYLGGLWGLEAMPAWTGQSDQTGARYGVSVAGAGDVNGDGYGDIVVGAEAYDNGQTNEGRAFVYHGSSSGVSANADWTAESDQAHSYFGFPVALAGDVNADGFSDVIVAASQYDNGQTNEGRVFVYHGSSGGVSANADWTAESNQANAELGNSVASAGDMTGDGYDDVIVGAWLYDGGQGDEGRAYVFDGSSSGLSGSASWTSESDQADAYYGSWVSGVVDVNGDGYGDVIVGAPNYDNGESNEGRAYVFYGSTSGPAGTADWTVESDQAGAGMGAAVAAAGDVNGDGFSDILIGAPSYSNGQNYEGRVSVFYGNGDEGGADPGSVVVLPDQFRVTGGPIDLLGLSNSSSEFRLKATGRSAIGRTAVRLEWAVEPYGSAFGSTSQGSWHDTGSPGQSGSYYALNELVTNLDASTSYHWRFRIGSRSPYFPHSPWFTEARSLPTQKHLLTAPSDDERGPGSELVAGDLSLGVVQPNPLTTRTTIGYRLATSGSVNLSVFDVSGRRLRTLVDGPQGAGAHLVQWDGRDEAGAPIGRGVYFARLDHGGDIQTAKITVAR